MQHFIAAGASGTWWHVVSRTAGRRFLFEEKEREWFAQWLRRVEAYSGVEVVTWAMLSNHFHIVVFVPRAPEDGIGEDVFWQRMVALYGHEETQLIQERLDAVRREKPGEAGEQEVEALLQTYRNRMYDLSAFMKTLLQRFTSWFNREHQHHGWLWEGPFKSLLIEGDWNSVSVAAAYVDLNAVRVGLVKDPKEYRWCGYAEAVARKPQSRSGLMHAFDMQAPGPQQENNATEKAETSGKASTWRKVNRAYKELLYGPGGKPLANSAGKPDDETLSLPELLRRRVRYFSDGGVLGSREFVDEMFATQRAFFGKKRKSGARKMRGGQWNNLYCLRDLRKAPVEGLDE